jgi:hypothetical protein
MPEPRVGGYSPPVTSVARAPYAARLDDRWWGTKTVAPGPQRCISEHAPASPKLPELSTAGVGMGDATACCMVRESTLDSIDLELLTAVTGAGLSLGERAAPENPNSWAAPLDRHAIATANGDRATIDPGMLRMPENPNMDPGIWHLPPVGNPGSNAGSMIDI